MVGSPDALEQESASHYTYYTNCAGERGVAGAILRQAAAAEPGKYSKYSMQLSQVSMQLSQARREW